MKRNIYVGGKPVVIWLFRVLASMTPMKGVLTTRYAKTRHSTHEITDVPFVKYL